MKKIIVFLLMVVFNTLLATPVELDLRNRTEPVTYYVAFIARSSDGIGPGHAYVSWGKEDHQAKMSWGESYGFYPITVPQGFISIVIEVPGKMVDEVKIGGNFKEKKYFVVKVNKNQFENTRQVFKKWKTDVMGNRVKYKLLSKNCAHFVKDVLVSLKLKAPNPDMKFPLDYFEEIVNKNQGSQ